MTAAAEETNELRRAALRLYGTLFKYDLHKRVRGGGGGGTGRKRRRGRSVKLRKAGCRWAPVDVLDAEAEGF